MVVAIILILIIPINFNFIDSNSNSSRISTINNKKNNLENRNYEKLLSNTPISFTENRGQLENDEVRFYDHGGSVWFTDDGMWFELRDKVENENYKSESHGQGLKDSFDSFRRQELQKPLRYKGLILKQEFAKANQVRPVGRERLSWNSNYFFGNEQSKWCSNVPNFGEVYYENLYDGIDLRYYSNEKGLKYDLIVHPRVNYKQIRIKYEGANELKVDQFGNLIIKSQIKNIREDLPIIYQHYNGTFHYIEGAFKIINNLEYSFEILKNYNPNEILIIDPNIELEYSTYLGGSSWETSNGIDLDFEGNVYITGSTNSFDFPNTTGAFDNTYNDIGTYSDVFIFKLNPNGSSLIYSTYIGGDHYEESSDIAVDSAKNTIITGITYSTDFPTTQNAYDRIYNGSDVFVVKIANNGSMLIYSTYVGGNGQDYSGGIAMDSEGNAYVAGGTLSWDFPITSSAYDMVFNGPDCFVFKLNQNGSTLIYSTFLGGSGGEGDTTTSITVDSNGNAYITSTTNSSDFPTTFGAYDTTLNGFRNLFVVKLNWNGSKLLYSTYMGSTNSDRVVKIINDFNGNVYVTGWTNSSNFPTTLNSYDTNYNGGTEDAFLFKLNYNGSKLIYSTYIGGSNIDYGYDITIGTSGKAYLIGATNSIDFPTTADAYDSTCNNWDVFLLILSSNGSMIEYSTYVGGGNNDAGIGISLDLKGNVYVTGNTDSSDFPITSNSFDKSINGSDIFVFKLLFPIKITSLKLYNGDNLTDLVYSKYCPYTFRVNITDPISLSDLLIVNLNLDPQNTNIQLQWNQKTQQFSKVFDPNNYVTIEQSSKAYNNSINKWTIDFNLTFNWTYPDEELHDVEAYIISSKYPKVWLNVSNLYHVENDLMFNGTLLVINSNNDIIKENDLIMGGEILNWTGLILIYENSLSVYPSDNNIKITIWDEDNNLWIYSPFSGEPFYFEIFTPDMTKSNFKYIVNLTGIPPECDLTNTTFIINIDADNVTFSKPIPENNSWQTKTLIDTGVTISDTGGGEVKASSVKYSYSIDNGTSWSNWKGISKLTSGTIVKPLDIVFFEEGTDNLIKWQADDTVGNGPTFSPNYRILVDTEKVSFSNATPNENYESPTNKIEVGITISDVTSGVNSSSIEYTISTNNGNTWGDWIPVLGFKDGNRVELRLNQTFVNGTGNRIKWRAKDIAGNGPTESKAYSIKVNTWLQTLVPRVKLLSPENNTIITSQSINLVWSLENKNIFNVTYDIYFEDFQPFTINITGISKTNFIVKNLIHGETYYWYVLPKQNNENGICVSGIWSFTVDLTIEYPTVQLKSPKNGSIITSTKPTFIWNVIYNGTEELSYDIYLDKNQVLMKYEKQFNTYFLPKTILEDGQTYYWKVVPWAGNIIGPESEVWSFTIKTNYIPKIELDLLIEPLYLELFPGNVTNINAKITNFGEFFDTITLNKKIFENRNISVIINEPVTKTIDPGKEAEFNISIKISLDAKPSEYNITFIATSGKAFEFGLTIEEKANLTVKILEISKPKQDKTKDDFPLWIVIIIIAVLIFVIILFFYFFKRKKAQDEDSKIESNNIQKNEKSALTEKIEEKEIRAKENVIKDDNKITKEI
jgi:hypothetical protein